MSSDTWLGAAREKRLSQYSPVVLIESNDPRRVKQAFKFAVGVGFDGPETRESVYDYAEWAGLRKLVPTEEGGVDAKPVEGSTGGALDFGSNDLKQIDAYLREGATVIVHDFVTVPKDLVAALNAWSVDGEVLGADSTVLAFLPSGQVPESVRLRCNVVRAPLSTSDEREEIVEALEAKAVELGIMKRKLTREARKSVVAVTGGLDLNQMEGKLAETINVGKPFDLQLIKDAKSALFSAMGLRVIEGWKFGFEAIGGYAMLKEYIQQEVVEPIRLKDRADKYGIKVAKGMILFGPPGTGKTLFGKALSKEVAMPMVLLNAADIFSKWVGESEQRVRQIMEIVQGMAPVVLFIDEIDQFGMARGGAGDGDSGTTRRVTNQLLSWLSDQQDIFVVGTTNVIEQMDAAFLRSGRFDLIAPMDFPDAEARTEIFRIQCEVVRSPPREALDYAKLAARTDYATGSDIEEIVVKATKRAMLRDGPLSMADFDEILKAYTVPKDARRKQRAQMQKAAEENLRDRRWFEAMKAASVDVAADAKRIRGA